MTRGLRWPIAMALVLASTVAANIWVVVVANGDPSFAIESDYYQKAVAWDSTLAQDRTNAALGWRLVPSLGAFAPASGAELRVALSDSLGAPIRSASVRVAAIFNARAGDVFEATLTASVDGGYVGSLPVAHAGQWELRFDVHRGEENFTAIFRVEARAAPGTP